MPTAKEKYAARVAEVESLQRQLNERPGEAAVVAGLLVEAAGDGQVTYLFDDTTPAGGVARARADRAVQNAAGRVDPVATHDARGVDAQLG